jgi:hypothetical protein
MARMKTGGPGDPPKTKTSNSGDWAKYDAYVKAKGAYDKDKTEYDARWKKANESSRGSISPYNFEAGPEEVKMPQMDKVRTKSISEAGKFNKSPKMLTKKEPTSKGEFINPKVAVKSGKRVTPGSVVKTANLRGAKPQVDTKNKPFSGYNKEARQFKAYAGTTATGESLIAKSAQEIGQYKNEMKGMRKEYRKEAPSDTRAMGLAATTSEIRQARKAERFVKGPQKSFTDKNYGGNIAKDYRESSQNAANRNTMDAKIKAAGNKSKSKPGSFGNMPTS